MDPAKEVLTTGQVAKICRVAPRTVSKWFDSGQLRGYRIPGSKDRRIPLAQLVRFMKAYGIPLDGLEGLDLPTKPRVLVVDDEADLCQLIARSLNDSARFEARAAGSAFEAGAIACEFHPNTIVVDVDIPGISGRVLSRWLNAQLETQETRLIGMSASMTEADRQALLQEGFAETLAKPFTIRDLVDLLEGVPALHA